MNLSPPLLLETVKIEDGRIFNLPYHQKRCDYSRRTLFHAKDILDLSEAITPPADGLYQCRILYNNTIRNVEYISYIPKKIDSLRIISSDTDYHYKYADRKVLNALLSQNPDVDEIIIEQKGLLTDTTISNIAFYDGETWFTPKTPLLHGTMRAKLIEEGFLQTKDILKKELHLYTQVALINAMLGFKVLNHFNIQT